MKSWDQLWRDWRDVGTRYCVLHARDWWRSMREREKAWGSAVGSRRRALGARDQLRCRYTRARERGAQWGARPRAVSLYMCARARVSREQQWAIGKAWESHGLAVRMRDTVLGIALRMRKSDSAFHRRHRHLYFPSLYFFLLFARALAIYLSFLGRGGRALCTLLSVYCCSHIMPAICNRCSVQIQCAHGVKLRGEEMVLIEDYRREWTKEERKSKRRENWGGEEEQEKRRGSTGSGEKKKKDK